MLLWTLSHFFVTSLKTPIKGDENPDGGKTSSSADSEYDSSKPRMKNSQKRSSKATNFGLKALARAYIELKVDAIREYFHSKAARHSRKLNMIRISV